MMEFSRDLIHELAQKFGNAYYILDINAFENNYHEFRTIFRKIYPNSNIAYSYKTNYIPKLCQFVNSQEGYAEVVSRLEYELALRIGVQPQYIIFNGPFKSKSDLEQALLTGSIVNLDSYYEIPLVKEIAQQAPQQKIRIGIRCNFDIGNNHISRFGFDVGQEEFPAIFETLRSEKNCEIIGLHCHFSTSSRSTQSYELRVEKMFELCRRYFKDELPKFIDIGGGFFSKMSSELKQQFDFPIPDYQAYANSIATKFRRYFPIDPGPELILEPGTAITANIMQFAVQVIDLKTVGTRNFALVSGSVHNIKPTLNDKNLPIEIYRQTEPDSKLFDGIFNIVGYTCMENDYLYKNYKGLLGVGDYILFNNVGAYTNVLKPPFIRPCPPIILIDKKLAKYEVIKRQEEFDDVFSTYIF